MNDDFYRIRRLPPYVFAEVNAMKAAARARGEDIIDLGMGNPDLPTPQSVVDKLCEVVRDPRTLALFTRRGALTYTDNANDQSLPGFTRVVSYAREMGVDYVAMSFVQRPEDVLALREEMQRLDRVLPIIAKIAQRQARNRCGRAGRMR